MAEGEASHSGPLANNVPPNIDFTKLSIDSWLKVTNTLASIKSDLEKAMTKKDGNATVNASFLQPILKGISCLESELSVVAEHTFDCNTRIEKLEKIVLKNEDAGNLCTKVENSVIYKDMCEELKSSAFVCKVVNFELENEAKSTKDIITEVKKKLIEQNINDDGKFSIIPLRKDSVLYEGKIVAPILFKAKNVDDKFAIEKKLRDSGLKTTYHWPKQMFPIVKKIRDQVSKYEKDDISFKNHQILIRPNFNTGKSLILSVREGSSGKWKYIESFQTPATDDLLAKLHRPQVTKSDFFKI